MCPAGTSAASNKSWECEVSFMKREIFGRALMGFPIGIAIGYCITIAISWSVGDGLYYPCVPAMEAQMGSQIAAATLQTALCGLMGSGCAVAAVAFRIERWSLFRATVVNFCVISLSILPAAYCSHWMRHTAGGVLGYFGVFLGIYLLVWCCMFLGWKEKIRRINERLHPNS